MGQSSSSLSFDDLLTELSQDNLLSSELNALTYEQFLERLGQLNVLAKTYADSDEHYLKFGYKKGSEETVLWKLTLIIVCMKIDSKTEHIIGSREFRLPDFLKVFKTLMCQYSAAEQSLSNVTASTVFQNLNDITDNQSKSFDVHSECCICFERQPDMSLPCAHSYCVQCIEKWKKSHDTCPICRVTMENDGDWELTNIPKSEEIQQEIRSNLANLATEDEPPSCSNM